MRKLFFYLLLLAVSGGQIISGGQSGVPVTQVDLTLQGANIAATTILTPGANGFYRASLWCVLTRAATTSSTLPSARIRYTDADSNSAFVDQLTNVNSTNLLGANGRPFDANSDIIGPMISFYAKSGIAIQYDTIGYASVGATSMQYALHIRLEGPF